MRRILMYARPACGLCDRAREGIMRVRETVPFAYEEVSIEGHGDLEREYGLRVPVVLVDGEEQFELEVDPDRLRALVAGA